MQRDKASNQEAKQLLLLLLLLLLPFYVCSLEADRRGDLYCTFSGIFLLPQDLYTPLMQGLGHECILKCARSASDCDAFVYLVVAKCYSTVSIFNRRPRGLPAE